MNTPTVETGDNTTYNFEAKHPVLFVLDRLRSAHNVGNIFRIAELTALEGVVTCGYTATPPHPKLAKTAMGCDDIVPFEYFETSLTAAKELKSRGYNVIAVETVEDAPLFWDYKIPEKTAFIFGNEALGIEQDTLNICDGFVKLPVYGFKNSLNVGNCASVIAYEVARQFSCK